MTLDDIINTANYVGIKGPSPARQGFKMYASPDRLKQFAKAIAEKERKECLQLCISIMIKGGLASDCVNAIQDKS